MNKKIAILCLTSASLFLTFSATAVTPGAIDKGPLTVMAGSTPLSLTITLALPHLAETEDLARAMYTSGDPNYHQFLSAQQFAERFAPSEADFASAIMGLAKYNLSAQKTSASTLRVTGMPADVEKAFSVSLHQFEVPALGDRAAYTFHAPINPPVIPAEVGVPVAGIAGLDNFPAAHPHIKRPAQAVRAVPASGTADLSAQFGYLTVKDFAQLYDVEPLYEKGVTGGGRTIGIMTLAAFTPSDAFAYWSALKLKVAADRIKIVNIDGGPGAPSDDSGSDETTLDVEQSGGIAPGARIIVYQAPNTNQGFVDMFAAAIDANARRITFDELGRLGMALRFRECACHRSHKRANCQFNTCNSRASAAGRHSGSVNFCLSGRWRRIRCERFLWLLAALFGHQRQQLYGCA